MSYFFFDLFCTLQSQLYALLSIWMYNFIINYDLYFLSCFHFYWIFFIATHSCYKWPSFYNSEEKHKSKIMISIIKDKLLVRLELMLQFFRGGKKKPSLNASAAWLIYEKPLTHSVSQFLRVLGSIPGRVIPKTQKMVLDASLLNTQHYKVRIKGKVEQSREGVAPSPTPWCSSYRKGSLRVTLDYGRQLYLLILYIKIKEHYAQLAGAVKCTSCFSADG